MAPAGATEREILAAYYPGTVVGLTAQRIQWRVFPGERVELWTAEESSKAEAQKRWIPLAETALRSAELRAGWTVGSRVILRLFPSVAAFRDATGESGSVLASTRGTVIRAQPALDRMLDEATLRHEMWHVVIEGRATPEIPDWFREGLAIVMSGGVPRSDERTAARDRVRSVGTRFGPKEVLSWLAPHRVPAGAFAQ